MLTKIGSIAETAVIGDHLLRSMRRKGDPVIGAPLSLDVQKEKEWLEEQWQRWLTLFPNHFSMTPAEHHGEFWDWVWTLELGIAPEDDFVAIWSRDGGKSTNVEGAVVSLGVRGKRKYCLYISETQEQADDHVGNIGRMIESSEIEKYYPEFAHPKVNKVGALQGWRHNRLWTDGGFVIDALGLDVAKRGVKLDFQRPDLLVVDDIDGESDSATATKKKIRTLTRKLIPAGSKELAVMAAQNLVHSDSVFSQLADGRADFLVKRKVSGPHPALRGLQYETRSGRTLITAGEPTWIGQDVAACQRLINKIGIEAFLIECQHEVDRPVSGAIYAEWDEVYHVITQSEFARFFEQRDAEGRINGVACHDEFGNWRLPGNGRCAQSLDMGTTPKHPMVTGWYWRPSQGMPLTDSIFRYREMCRPRYPGNLSIIEDKTTSRRIGIEIQRLEYPWREDERMAFRILSHEASDEHQTFLKDLPDQVETDDGNIEIGALRFEKWQATDRRAGIRLAQNFIGIDRLEEHPFRRLPGGVPLMGRPRFYVVVPDDQGELYFDQRLGQLKARKPIDESGQSRFRAEVPKYHYAESAEGVEGRLPYKDFDDAMDEFKAMFKRWGPKIEPMSAEERLDMSLPEKLQRKEIDKLPPEQKEIAEFNRYTAYHAARDESEKKKPENWRPIRNKYRRRRPH